MIEWNEAYELIKKHGKKIATDAEKGNENAKEIMKYYGWVYACPGDGFAKTLCCDYFEKWASDKKGLIK